MYADRMHCTDITKGWNGYWLASPAWLAVGLFNNDPFFKTGFNIWR
jgi:hypothetical protein